MEQFSSSPPDARAELPKLKPKLNKLAGHESVREDRLRPSEAKPMAFSQSQDQVKKIGKKEARFKRLVTSGVKQAIQVSR